MGWKITIAIFAAGLAVGMAGMVGGPTKISIDDEEVLDALQFAVVQHNKATNDLFVRKVAEVLSAQKQIVAGVKYIINVRMGKTPCKKGGVEQECKVYEDPELAQHYLCTFEVWSRPWIGAIELVKQKCE